MAADDSSDSGNSMTRTWVAIGILVVLAVLLATQFGKIRQTLGELFKKDDAGPQAPVVISKLKDFDLTKLKVPKEYAVRCDEYQQAAALTVTATEPVGGAGIGYLQDADMVIGVKVNNATCAYPIGILRHRLVVNHELGGQPIVVTYSPLSMTTGVFSRKLGSAAREFETTTQLYHNALLFHDKGQAEDTLWNHVTGEGLIGPDTGKKLEPIAHSLTTWARWKAQHPDTQAILREGSFEYGTNFYSAFPIDAPEPRYPFANPDKTLEWFDPVLGVRVGDATMAYPMSVLKNATGPISGTLGGKSFQVEYVGDNPDYASAVVTSADDGVLTQYALWFAWHAYYPETQVYKP